MTLEYTYIPSVNYSVKSNPKLIHPIKKSLYIQKGILGDELMISLYNDTVGDRKPIPNTQFHLKTQHLIEALELLGALDISSK